MADEYRRLRENEPMSGAFDFGEWEMNGLAERLEREGRLEDAIQVAREVQRRYPTQLSFQ